MLGVLKKTAATSKSFLKNKIAVAANFPIQSKMLFPSSFHQFIGITTR